MADRAGGLVAAAVRVCDGVVYCGDKGASVSVVLNEEQYRALGEITRAVSAGNRHLLTGYAGSGKTTLMQYVAREMLSQKKSVILSAPTHKAVAVLASKLETASLGAVPTMTVHRLLSLRPKNRSIGEATVFERDRHAPPVVADVVVIDECSMLSADMMKHIRRHLAASFVLFVGDPAQLPPVGEVESESFATKSRSHLGTIVRQAAGNPVLEAAGTIRSQQRNAADWSWIKPARAKPYGVYLPGAKTNDWMRKAFTSDTFKADPDSFRYLCWTNKRVSMINQQVRRWIYGGKTDTPYAVGERVMFRNPFVLNKAILFNTNEEATVVSIEADDFNFPLPDAGPHFGWVASIPSWRLCVEPVGGGESIVIHAPRDLDQHKRVMERIIDEAQDWRDRWDHRRDFASAMGDLRHIYALTVHTSQGSTFGNVFIDVADIRKRERENLLECQQLYYVAMTRPTTAAILVNA